MPQLSRAHRVLPSSTISATGELLTPRDEALEALLGTRSQAGDRPAFEQLVRRTARVPFARLYLQTGSAHAAEDLAQETFLVAWRSVRQVTDPRGFRTWLLSIAH